MNAREKEQYLREYSILKSQGKPFSLRRRQGRRDGVHHDRRDHPDGVLFGRSSAPEDPTTTTYTPRPQWYFSSCSLLCRVKPPELVFLATSAFRGLPGTALVLPFFDHSRERTRCGADRRPPPASLL